MHLARRPGERAFARVQRALGARIVHAAPWLMKGLAYAGTAAMFLVGGGILVHGIPLLHDAIGKVGERVDDVPGAGVVFGALTPMLASMLAGMVAGAIVYAGMATVRRLRSAAASQAG